MPPRLSLKPDSSFFRKIAIGAVGARAICTDLAKYGHNLVELERGSLDTKLWKDVKRKRVRIPDLVCTKCGQRIESRAKTNAKLSMSHSPTEEARAWDYGMVDTDIIAFPVCEPISEDYWSSGFLGASRSYWHERTWVDWCCRKRINYFTVKDFRAAAHTGASTKGVTEGMETSISWQATFSTREGIVEAVDGNKITILRRSDSRRYTWTIRGNQIIVVSPGDSVSMNQVIASTVIPLPIHSLSCSGNYSREFLTSLLESRERTLRFTGVKLARLNRQLEYRKLIESLQEDSVEDIYVRLEAASYLASVCAVPVEEIFKPYLESNDKQTQLEAVIALGETGTDKAVALLIQILDDTEIPYFLRSAAAWSLSRIGGEAAITRLIGAFSDVDANLRAEALDGILTAGAKCIPSLLQGLSDINQDIAAGCAEALRQLSPLPNSAVSSLIQELNRSKPSIWTVWLSAHMPKAQMAEAVSELQNSAPELHYAITLLWSFIESWIARYWELETHTKTPDTGEICNVE